MHANIMKCAICKSRDLAKIKPYAAENSFFAGSKICLCGACGMQMISPFPSEDAWETYNKSYFVNAHGGLNSSKSESSTIRAMISIIVTMSNFK